MQCFVYLHNGNENKIRKIVGDDMRGAAGLTKTIGSQARNSLGKSKFEDALNEEIDPPLCMTVRSVGHSFSPGSQPFIPMIKF
jgi:hypothetical protein